MCSGPVSQTCGIVVVVVSVGILKGRPPGQEGVQCNALLERSGGA